MKILVREIDIRSQRGRDNQQKFLQNEFWKCISFILLAGTYEKKRYKLWAITTRKDPWKAEGQIYRDVNGNTELPKVSFTFYHLH